MTHKFVASTQICTKSFKLNTIYVKPLAVYNTDADISMCLYNADYFHALGSLGSKGAMHIILFCS